MDKDRFKLILDSAFKAPSLTTAAAAADAAEEMYGDQDSVMWLVHELKAMIRKAMFIESLGIADYDLTVRYDSGTHTALVYYRDVQLRKRHMRHGDESSRSNALESLKRLMEYLVISRVPLLVSDLRRLIT